VNGDSQNPEKVSRGRGRPRVDDKRRKILDAALEAFAKRGYHGVTVPEVAEAAGIGAGTMYRYFADKQDLVNHVFRDAKARLRDAIFESSASGLRSFVGYTFDPAREPRALFLDLWGRLVGFARAEPLAFQFLEMQDHTPYLDAQSRQFELGVLIPMWLAGQQLAARGVTGDLPVHVGMALVWGALVGLFKSERLGYLQLDDATLVRAGEACWAALSPPPRG
jgi:AcrR family transcriptional regulator